MTNHSKTTEAPTTARHDDHDNDVDDERMAMAEEHMREERLLRAAHELRQLPAHLLTPRHQQILAMADNFEAAIADLIEDPSNNNNNNDTHDGGAWKKQGESHGKRDTLIYYKVDGDARLTCRIETPIEASLLVPILSVLNETCLYETWIPSWRIPNIGIATSEQLEQTSRGTQTIRILANVPWPYSQREGIIKAVAVDEIDERGFVAIRLSSKVPVGGVVVPPPPPNVERIDFEGAMLLRPCPRNHELLLKSKHVYREPLILVSFKMFVDPHMTGIPSSLINFVTRTVIGTIWSMFLSVAEGVRAGNRPLHKQAIREKKEFYDWMKLRIGLLLEKAAMDDPMMSPKTDHRDSELLEAQNEFIMYLQG